MSRCHLLQMPPMGGTPITHKAPRKKAKKVNGILRPRPLSWLTSVLCAATRMAPAQKNSVILPKACMAMCIAEPMIANGVARAAPMTM